MLKIIILFLGFAPLAAQVSDSVDQGRSRLVYYKTQFAGNLGLISAGAGYEFPVRKLWIDMSLGYLPKHVNGVRVFTLSLKPAYKVADFDIKRIESGWYLGTAINYSFGRNIFGSMPDYYPLDYYWPNAFHFNPFAGTRLSLKKDEYKKNKTYFYAELGTVDYEIWFALKNRQVNLVDIFNLGFGIVIRPNLNRDRYYNKESD